jgi:RNA polymerase sigma-70 factor (ECF subfamily)
MKAVLEAQLFSHRPELLRHCYRMLGSYADAEDLVQETLLRAWRSRDSFAGDAPLSHWLMRIATNACLTELEARKRRSLPQLDSEAAVGVTHVDIESSELSLWISPAPDAKLFPEPAQVLEARESVALAFVALLQRLSARQRAAFLLKEVLDWSVEEVATALEMSESAVSSALHRARETVGWPRQAGAVGLASTETRTSAPPPELVLSYVQSWERRDIDTLLSLMRKDIVFSMPPYSTWFHDRSELGRFLRGPQFGARWSAGFRTQLTLANRQLAIAFYRRSSVGDYEASSIQMIRFEEDRVSEIVCFIGPEYLRGFELPERMGNDARSE